MKKNYWAVDRVTINNKDVNVYRIVVVLYGNPRGVVKISELGLNDEEYSNINKKYGFNKYRGKWIDNAIVLKCWNVQEDTKYMFRKIEEENRKRILNKKRVKI